MSKSYRKPFYYLVGGQHVKADRQLAARMVRRKQNTYLREFDGDYDEFLIPHKYECTWNERWNWNCDSDYAKPVEKLDRELMRQIGLHKAGHTHYTRYGIPLQIEEDILREFERGYTDWYLRMTRK